MKKLYFFKSSHLNDEVNNLTIFASSITKAYTYAFNYFIRHNCSGIPQMIAI